MKKIVVIALLMVLLTQASFAAQAAQSSLSIDSATAKSGETVFLKVKLEESAVGNAVGVSFTYDPDVLQLVEDSCAWAREGVIQDFDAGKNAGVWTVSKPIDVKGEVCTLAFRVISEADYFNTKIVCRLIVKNGVNSVVDVTAEATVSARCDHEYDDWTNIGDVGHKRICKYCGNSQTQSHHYDEGVKTTDPNRPNIEITTYTCQDCKTQKIYEQVVDYVPTEPTIPAPTEPDYDFPTWPTKPEDHDDHDHDHDHPTLPNSGNTDATKPTTEEDHDHDHSSGGTRLKIGIWGVLAFWGIFGALILGAVLFLKKRR